MANNSIKNKIFHYEGVDYSIFAKYVDAEGGERNVAIKRFMDNGKDVVVWDMTAKGWTNIPIEKLILTPYGEKTGGKKYGVRAKFDDSNANLRRECAGWKIYEKTVNIKGEDRQVTKIVKNRETKPRSDWDNVRGDITVNGGVKWNKVDQTFERWSLMDEEDMDRVCALLKKYYAMEESEKEQEEMPEPMPEEKGDDGNGEDAGLDIFLTFARPEKMKEYTLLSEQKMNCLEQIYAMLESFTSEEKNDKDFVYKYLKNKIWFVNPITGVPFTFPIPSEIPKDIITRRIFLRQLLNTILYIGGIPEYPIGYEAITGMMVRVDGESNYFDNKDSYESRRQDDPFTEVEFEEDWRTGGLIHYKPFYALAFAVTIAQNYINNYFVASFKYPDFSQAFLSTMTKIEVKLNNPFDNSEEVAEVYYRNDGNNWIYIIKEGGYAALYSNDFLEGFSTVDHLIYTTNPPYLDYVKDIDGFGESKMSASKYYPQLMEKYPQIFGKESEAEFNIGQAIIDVKLLLSLEDDPVEYAWLTQKIADLELLQSLS